MTRLYLECTKLCGLGGRFWNPFIFASLALPVLILCLAVYFIVHARDAFIMPPDASKVFGLVLVVNLVDISGPIGLY